MTSERFMTDLEPRLDGPETVPKLNIEDRRSPAIGSKIDSTAGIMDSISTQFFHGASITLT